MTDMTDMTAFSDPADISCDDGEPNSYPTEPLPADTCTECQGHGWVEGERLGGQFEQLTCSECDGTGSTEADDGDGDDTDADPQPAATLAALALTIPPLPAFNFADPSDADLLALTAHMATILALQRFGVEPEHANSPAQTLGRLKALTDLLTKLLEQRAYVRERDARLMQRLDHEARQEPEPEPSGGYDRATGIACHGEI